MKDGWISVTLDSLADVSAGQAAPQGAEMFGNTGHPFVRAGSLDFLTKGGDESELEHVDESVAVRHGLRLFPADTVLFAKSGMSATKGLIYRLKQPCHVVSHLAALVPGEALAPEYLTRWLEAHPPTALISNSAYPSIRLSQVSGVNILLPKDVEEQRRIATILDKADAIRRKRHETIRMLDDFLRSVFLDMFRAHIEKTSETVFGDLLEEPLNNGFFAKNDVYGEGVPVVWVDNLYHTMSIKTDGLRRARMTTADLDKYAVRDGDLLFTRSSLVAEGVGQVNIVPALDEPTAFECHIIRARVDRRKLNPFYVLGLYRSAFGKQHILRNANTATMTTISQSAIERLPCPVPPLHLQNDFEKIVRKTGGVRNSLERASHVDEELMKCLMQRAFKGEI